MGHPLGVVLRNGCIGGQLESLPQTLLCDLSQVGHRSVSLRNGKTRHLVVAEDVVVLNFLGNSHGVGNGLTHNIRL